MAKDYFQDIIPSHDGDKRRKVPVADTERDDAEVEVPEEESPAADRSIRNLNINSNRPRRAAPEVPPRPTSRRRSFSKRWLWIIGALVLVALAAVLLLALRPTSVTVTPRTHTVVFDETSQFTAFAADSSTTGSLAYTVQTLELEDSEPVASSGTVHAEEKASGQITIYNSYSAAPVKLIKSTRFATPEGLIFLAPAEIVVPGMTGTTPGSITVSVIAAEAGQKYNSGPFDKLTLPGLKSSPDMYAKVYAKSTAAFSGGFSGEKPGVSAEASAQALAAMRGRLEEKARAGVRGLATNETVVFPDMMRITYEALPAAPETGDTVRLREKARVAVPVFDASAFAAAVARSVSTDADNAALSIVPGEGYGARILSASSTLGVDPLQFTLTGNATILWNVDTEALAKALAGRDQGAFQTIVGTFPSIQEARARIEPFWSTTFPTDPAEIAIRVETPTE